LFFVFSFSISMFRLGRQATIALHDGSHLDKPMPFESPLRAREHGPSKRRNALTELWEYVARRGWTTFREYVDTGWSGSLASRPELDRLMNDARTRRFDAVLVWKLDRWGRSVAQSVRSIQELVALGVRFLAVTQNIDTDESNPTSRFLLHIFAAFAELEKEMIRERVVSGLKMARINGKSIGRPKRIFRRDEAIKLRAEGISWRKISKKLDVPVSTLIDACEQNVILNQ
jgi:putative DNA-invertase from lambdoid prophage Rac